MNTIYSVRASHCHLSRSDRHGAVLPDTPGTAPPIARLCHETILNVSCASGLWKLWDLLTNPFSSSKRFNSHDTAVNVSRIFLIFFGQSRWRAPLVVETSFHSTFSYELRFTSRMSNALIKIFVTPFSNSVGSLNKSCNSDFACRSSFKQKFRGKFLAEGFTIVD